MKRSLLAVLCVLVLLLAGCTTINQTNSFVVRPTSEAQSTPEITATPEVTATPDAMTVPEDTQPPVVQLEIQPTPEPGSTDMPADMPWTAVPSSTPAPSNSPAGFNG